MIGRYSDQMTFEAILSSMLDRVPNTVDKREGSVIYDALAPAAAEMAKAYIELDVIMDETFVDTASMQYLMMRCRERGVPIQPATEAVIEGTFTPASLELETGSRFNCGDQNYIVTEKVGDGKYRLECETAGICGNLYSGFLLPIQYIEGLETAEITDLLILGEDADDADALRKRYYDSLDSLSFGGNIADYKNKVRLIDGVGGVKVLPVWDGGGTVKLTIIDSEYEAPSSALIAQVQTEVDPSRNQGEGFGIAPIGHTVTVEGVTAFPVTVRSDIVFVDGWSFEAAKSQLENAVREYFHEISAAWADEEVSVVRISQIENKLLNLSCVLDISGTSVNGGTANIQLAYAQIPELSSIEVTI